MIGRRISRSKQLSGSMKQQHAPRSVSVPPGGNICYDGCNDSPDDGSVSSVGSPVTGNCSMPLSSHDGNTYGNECLAKCGKQVSQILGSLIPSSKTMLMI